MGATVPSGNATDKLHDMSLDPTWTKILSEAFKALSIEGAKVSDIENAVKAVTGRTTEMDNAVATAIKKTTP
jgi:hypothetical protein